MASRKIIGTTHIRRKLSKKAKAAIAAVAVIAVGIGGFLFINNTDAGAGIKNKVAGMSIVSEDGGLGGLFGVGNTPASETQSIIRIDTDVVTVDEDDIFINRTGGYVNGGGTLREGDDLLLHVVPYDGYSLQSVVVVIKGRPGEVYTGDNWFAGVDLRVGYRSESADINVTANTTFEAHFVKKDSSRLTYAVKTYPEIGIYNDLSKRVGDTLVDVDVPDNARSVYFEANGVSDAPKGLWAQWQLSYSELDAYFNYTQESYSFGDNTTSGTNSSHTDTSEKSSDTTGKNDNTGTNTNNTVTIRKIYYVSYDVFVIDEDGTVIGSVLNCETRVPISFYEVDASNHKLEPVNDDLRKMHDIRALGQGATYDFALDMEYIPSNSTFLLVPHTKDGSAYQAITRSEPANAGTTYGDKTSGTSFTTTISATPAKGYKFDRWTWSEDARLEVGQNVTKEMDVKDRTVSVTPTGITVYTAHFIPETYNVELESATPDEGGSVVGTGDYIAHTDVKITLKPSPGYKVESWNYSTPDGSRYSGDSEEFTIKDITSDIKLNVKFTNGKARIDVKASPVDGGKVTVRNDNDKKGEKPDFEEFVPGKEKARLKAIPAENNIFLYWKDSAGKKYEGITYNDGVNTLDLPSVASSETFTAYFAPRVIKITTKVYPNYDNAGDLVNPGSITVSGDEVRHTTESPTEYSADSYTAVTFNAVEASGYHFQKFVDGDGNEYTSNPLVKTDLVKDTTITAIFIPDEFTITAQATPVTGGTANVAVLDTTADPVTVKSEREGSNTVSYNDKVRITATAKEGFIFRYFEDQHGTKYGGTVADDRKSAVFEFNAVNGAETYKAVFGLAELDLSISVDPDYYAGGFKLDYIDNDGNRFNPSEAFQGERSTLDGSIPKVKGGTSLKITAVEGDGYHFSKFVDTDGNVYTENPLVYPDLSENKDVEIIFVPDKFTISAQTTPVIGGTAKVDVIDHPVDQNVLYGREGSQEVAYNDLVRITATANPGYIFRYFEDAHGTKYSGVVEGGQKASFIFNAVNGSETYKAVFGLDKLSLNVKVDEVVEGDNPYKTGGYRVDYTNWWYPQPAESKTSYKEETFDDVAGGKTVKITAIPGDGYHFSKFVDTDGNVYTENPLVYPNLTENKDVEVIFVPDTFTISATASPSTGGSVDVAVLNDDGTISNKREGSNTVSYNDLVKLIAKPNSPGFDFRYFEDENGNKYGGKEETIDEQTYRTLDIKAVNGSEKYKAVFAISNITLDVKVDPKNVDDSDNYIAGGFKVDYTGLNGLPGQILPTYKPAHVTDIKGQTSVKITALDGDGYHFSKFVDTDGNVYTENPLVYPALVENKDVEIIFVPDRFTINAKSVPVTGGTVDVAIINKDTGAEISKREGSNEVSYNEKVRIIAKPSGNFAFRYFEDPNGAKYGPTGHDDSGNPYFEFNAVNGAETYKAVFAMSNISLTVKVDPATLADGKYEAGKFKVNYTYIDDDGNDKNVDVEGDAPGFEITNVKGQTSVKITAIELGGYKFSKFIDSEGNIWNDNPMVLGDLIENKEIEVIFVKEHWKIEGVSSPEAGGKVTLNGVESGVDVDYGDHVTIKATENPGYRFKYFKDDLGNEFLANPIDFDAINGSEKYTAYFAKDDVNITLDLAPEGAGTVRFESEPAVSMRTTYPTGGKSSVTLTATPKEDVSFLYWRDQDGKMYNDNPLVLSDISADLIFTAVFDTKYDTIRAVASPASGGRIRKIVNDNGSITLVAIANRGYSFIRWQKPVGTATVYRLDIKAEDVHSGDLYTAIFRADSNYDWRSDITKEKFYREWRKVITPNYTVTRDSMKLLAMQSVAGLRQYDDATPPLRSYGAIANAQAYFDEKTARDAARLDGVFGDAELMTAEGDILRPDALPDADKYQQDAEDFTDRKFGDLYETEILTVKRVLEPDDFDNIKRTYLWRYTGAEYKDNIYLLYNIGGSKPDWATPIVDEDGVLKFTIDELDSYDVVAVVRVKIKEK